MLFCSLSFVRLNSPNWIIYDHARSETQKFVAKRYNTTSDNLSNWMKKNGIKKPALRSPMAESAPMLGLRPRLH